MKIVIFRVISVALAILFVFFAVVGCAKHSVDETEDLGISTEATEPNDTAYSEETSDLQETDGSQESVALEESFEPQETNEPEESVGPKETDTPGETDDSQDVYVPEEPDITDGEPSPEYTAKTGSASGNVGDEVTVSVDVIKAPDMLAMSLKISYDDDALELTSVTSGEAMSRFTYVKPSKLKSGASFMWYANDPASAIGTALELTFKIKDGASAGDYRIFVTCDGDNTFDENAKNVVIEIVDGSITVTK